MQKLELGAVAEALRPGVEYPPRVAAFVHRIDKLGQRLRIRDVRRIVFVGEQIPQERDRQRVTAEAFNSGLEVLGGASRR